MPKYLYKDGVKKKYKKKKRKTPVGSATSAIGGAGA